MDLMHYSIKELQQGDYYGTAIKLLTPIQVF
jgi:hypothetical protein